MLHEPADAEGDVIQAAGALVWRDTPNGREIAIVHRRRYDDWTLPKGKLERGESWQEAARREVREETGCTVALADFAGCLCYSIEGTAKVVLFWNATLLDEGLLETAEEIDSVLWTSVPKALKMLDHESEREILSKENARQNT